MADADARRVRYRIDDRQDVILAKPDVVSIAGLEVGTHSFVADVTRGGKLIPGACTLIRGKFEVTEEDR